MKILIILVLYQIITGLSEGHTWVQLGLERSKAREGGRDDLELVMVFMKSCQTARVKRIGCTVNVYRNESKQRINPNDTIFRR